MRILVSGSIRGVESEELRSTLRAAGKELGQALARGGHTILVGSEATDDVDPYVVDGALSIEGAKSLEVHLMQGAADCYPQQSAANKVRNIPHRYDDWDVTVLEVLRRQADAVITIGGNVGVVQTGVGAWMLGKPVIPIAAFGGGARKVWGFGSGERRDFYFQALNDEEIDRLNRPWNSNGGCNAEFVVQLLTRVYTNAQLLKNPRTLFGLVSILVLIALGAWVATLGAPFLGVLSRVLGYCTTAPLDTLDHEAYKSLMSGARFVLLLISVCTAGALGGFLQTLRRMRDGMSVTAKHVTIDGVLGVAAGFLTAALYFVAQIAVTGGLDTPETDNDYVRVALIAGLAALFASLYLDAALARFDALKQDVFEGKHGAGGK